MICEAANRLFFLSACILTRRGEELLTLVPRIQDKIFQIKVCSGEIEILTFKRLLVSVLKVPLLFASTLVK